MGIINKKSIKCNGHWLRGADGGVAQMKADS